MRGRGGGETIEQVGLAERELDDQQSEGGAHLEMGVSWHDGVDLFLCSGYHDIQQVLQVRLDLGSLLHLTRVSGQGFMDEVTHEPNSHVRSDLIIPGSSGMQLSSNVLSNDL